LIISYCAAQVLDR